MARGGRTRRKLNTIKNRNSPAPGINRDGICTSEWRLLSTMRSNISTRGGCTKGNDIGTRKLFLLNYVSKRFFGGFGTGHRPGPFFLLQIEAKIRRPIQPTITLEVEGKKIGVTRKGAKSCNEEANPLGGNKEFEGAIKVESNLEMRCITT